MARFDVYRAPEGDGYLLDVQANLLTHLNTRIVVPLMLSTAAPKPAKGLNPEFMIGHTAVVMIAQFLSAVPISMLKEPVATLDQHHTKIVDAIDLALQGF
jgi:toxin CcdB